MLPRHSYEEIREMVVRSLIEKPTHYAERQPQQFTELVSAVAKRAKELAHSPSHGGVGRVLYSDDSRLSAEDGDLVREVFWDLFRQGYITLGIDNANSNYPWFMLSSFGRTALTEATPYYFHDVGSYLRALRDRAPGVADATVTYAAEAASTFYAGCLLSTSVMLGVAAENEFLRLVIEAAEGPRSAAFIPAAKDGPIRHRIRRFREALKPILPELEPRQDFEDIETNLDLIQSILRIARNEAGHPTGAAALRREQAYNHLQLFIPFAQQVEKLRRTLGGRSL